MPRPPLILMLVGIIGPPGEVPAHGMAARGSVFNKIVILLPMLLPAFAPWLLTPLLIRGGAYLCCVGAEKILPLIRPEADNGPAPKTLNAALLVVDPVAGAIKTDFILSPEIMTIALAQITSHSLWMTGSALALIGLGITVLVCGSVAILVKADDVGLRMAEIGRWMVNTVSTMLATTASKPANYSRRTGNKQASAFVQI